MAKNRGFSEKRKRPIEMRREKVYENMSKIQDGWRGQHCAGPRFNHKENYNG